MPAFEPTAELELGMGVELEAPSSLRTYTQRKPWRSVRYSAIVFLPAWGGPMREMSIALGCGRGCA